MKEAAVAGMNGTAVLGSGLSGGGAMEENGEAGSKWASCRKELLDVAITGAAQALQVGILKGIGQMAASKGFAVVAAFNAENDMPFMAARMTARATKEALVGSGRYVAGLTLTAAQVAEAWYSDAPWWYKVAKFVPGLGLGMEIGEAVNVCLLN
jgi:hypothetical protein